jgi:hypothetical protein
MEQPRPPRHDVVAWRSDLLVQAGCEPALAWELAGDGAIDLHDLLTLIDRGCPPQLAARILAPLDRPEPAATVLPAPREGFAR